MMRHVESNTQQAFVRWFRLQYPDYALCLTSIPNGGLRNAREAATLKREGMTAGAADLLLLIPRGVYGALGLEFKTLTGRQSAAQREWQKAFEASGNKYVVVRTLEEAILVANRYMNLK